MTWSLLQETPASAKVVKRLAPRASAPADFNRIRCPLCNWRPKPSDRWLCAPCDHPEYFAAGCWTAWNTFATSGCCPTCNHQWRWTSCLNCQQWSPHLDWYEKNDDKPV